MSCLHQINRLNYLEHCHNEIQLSLKEGDALLLIEEAVLRSKQYDSILNHASSLNMPIYLLAQDALAYGIMESNNEILTTDQWLKKTAQYNKHIAW